MTYAPGTILLWSSPDDLGVEDARAFVKHYGLTTDEAAIRRNDAGVTVVAKRKVTLCENRKS